MIGTPKKIHHLCLKFKQKSSHSYKSTSMPQWVVCLSLFCIFRYLSVTLTEFVLSFISFFFKMRFLHMILEVKWLKGKVFCFCFESVLIVFQIPPESSCEGQRLNHFVITSVMEIVALSPVSGWLLKGLESGLLGTPVSNLCVLGLVSGILRKSVLCLQLGSE